MAQALNILALIFQLGIPRSRRSGETYAFGAAICLTLTTRTGRVTECHLPGECKARERGRMPAAGTALPPAWHEAGAQLMLVD